MDEKENNVAKLTDATNNLSLEKSSDEEDVKTRVFVQDDLDNLDKKISETRSKPPSIMLLLGNKDLVGKVWILKKLNTTDCLSKKF